MTPTTQPPGDRIWYVADQEPDHGNGIFNGPQIAPGTALVEASHASALQAELDALREAIEEHRRKLGGNVYGDEAQACWPKATTRLWSALSTPINKEP